MNTGFVAGKCSFMASATSSVVRVQISMSSWRRSVSVIRPSSYWSWTAAARFSASSSSSAFLGGATTSSKEIVTPERVAHRKPRFLSSSRVAATLVLV